MLTLLEARGFRNLEPTTWLLEPGSHLLLGDNGAGKTSLLEAIYLLATTRSFRTSQLRDCRRHGTAGFALAAEIENDRRSRLEVVLDEKSMQRALNGQRTSLAEHLAAQPVICWSIGQAEVLSGGPGHRRRFLDRGLLGLRPAALEVMSRYRQTLAEKRRLLIEGGQGLEVWNQLQAESAAEWIRMRAEYVTALAKKLTELLSECDLGLPTVALHYRPSPVRGREGVEAIAAELMDVSRRERDQRKSLIGPHRDELEIRWAEHMVRKTASAGERKALGLLLLAAQGSLLVDHGKRPLYLLDDVDTELDGRRLKLLWRIFSRVDQMIVSSNRPAVWEEIDLDHRWNCRFGTLAPEGE